MKSREELQKIGHHEVYGDINYPKGIWFLMDELESFSFTGYCIAIPENKAIFDLYDTKEEACTMFREIFEGQGVHSTRQAEIWKLENSVKTEVVACNYKEI